MTAATSSTRQAVPLLLLGVAAFSSMASMRACDSLLPQLANDFSVSIGSAARMISSFALAYGLLQLAYGPLGDRIGKQRVIGWAAVGCALANLVVAFAPTLPWALVGRTLAGAASGGIIPVCLALIGDRVPYEQRQAMLARLLVATNFGLIAGQWLAGVVAEWVGWRLVFVLLALGFASITWPMLRGASSQPEAARASGADPQGTQLTQGTAAQMGAILRVRWARWILVTVWLEGMFAFAAFSFVPSFLSLEFGLSLSQAGAVMALYGLGGLAYALSARWLIPRLGERGLVASGSGLLGAALATLVWCPAWIWAVPACLFGGLGLYMLHGTLQTHATQMYPPLRGTAVSLFVVCLFGSQAIGVSLGGLLVDAASARWVFAAGLLVIPVLGAVFSLALHRHEKAAASALPS